MKGLDYTKQTTPEFAKKMKDAGYGFAARYLVPVSSAWKRLTKEEAEILSKAGIQILSVYETSANRASGGAAAGSVDGMNALNEAKIVGQPQGTGIYFAVDYDAQPKDYDAIERYFKVIGEQLKGKYKVGGYGSYAVIEEMFKRGVIELGWQTYAWSAGKKSSKANVYQYKNGQTFEGVAVDFNDSYGDEGFWILWPDVKDTPKPQPTPGAFKDVPDSHWAYSAIIGARNAGLMSGHTDDTFKPDEPVTRAELAVVLQRLVNKQ